MLKRQLPLAAVLLLTLLLYLPAAGFDFIGLDDPDYVTTNARVLNGLSRADVAWAFTAPHKGFWIPLTWVSYMADVQLFGPGPRGFHVTNIALHLLCTALLGLCLQAMTGAVWRPALAAALFGVHPLHVESVAWVAERKDVLSTAFFLAALGAYLRYARRPGVGRYLAVIVLFTLGLMAKPMHVTLPFVLLLLDYYPLGRLRLTGGRTALPASAPVDTGGAGPRAPRFEVLLEKVPILAVSLGFGLLTLATQKGQGAVGTLEEFSPRARLLNALVSYVVYVRKTLWPHDLAVFYVHPGDSLPWGRAALAGVLLLAVTISVVLLEKRRPFLAAGWFWYLATIFPVIGFMQSGMQAMADRFMYVPSIGLFLAGVWALPAPVARFKAGRILTGVAAAAAVALFSLATRQYLSLWRGSIPLFESALSRGQDHYLIRVNLGEAYLRAGRSDLALEQYRRGLVLVPGSALLHNNFGVVLEMRGDLAAAERQYRAAVDLDPRYVEARVNLGVIAAERGRPEVAEGMLRAALDIAPDNADAHYNLGLLLLGRGERSTAAGHFGRALELRPDFPQARRSLDQLRSGP